MASSVRIDAATTDILSRLTEEKKDGEKLFANMARAVAFAASLGAERNTRLPLANPMKSKPSPIDLDVFENQGLASLINIIAFSETQEPNVLANSSEAQGKRVQIFEEYANGGLQIIATEVKGMQQLLDAVLLIMETSKKSDSGKDASFPDLADL